MSQSSSYWNPPTSRRRDAEHHVTHGDDASNLKLRPWTGSESPILEGTFRDPMPPLVSGEEKINRISQNGQSPLKGKIGGPGQFEHLFSKQRSQIITIYHRKSKNYISIPARDLSGTQGGSPWGSQYQFSGSHKMRFSYPIEVSVAPKESLYQLSLNNWHVTQIIIFFSGNHKIRFKYPLEAQVAPNKVQWWRHNRDFLSNVKSWANFRRKPEEGH